MHQNNINAIFDTVTNRESLPVINIAVAEKKTYKLAFQVKHVHHIYLVNRYFWVYQCLPI